MSATIEFSAILQIAGAITTVGVAWLTIRKINKDLRKERALEAAKILQAAKEAVAKSVDEHENNQAATNQELTSRIDEQAREIENMRDNFEKDLQHIRETYNGEIRNLGQKIEDLRSELRNQHGQLVGLLTKMIDIKD
jgi:predicted RNase H-like nuclease (RuvC/YqgF family)